MSFKISIKINNNIITDHKDTVRITDSFPILNWEFDLANKVEINSLTGEIEEIGELIQYSFEIRISTSKINIGKDVFIGNRAQTGTIIQQTKSWIYAGVPLERGFKYYGQIRVVDESGRSSDWTTFSFLYNSLPYIDNIKITPILPSISDNLVLSYDFHDGDGDEEYGTIIRWFKNGVLQKQLKNSITIDSYLLQKGDIWYSEITPCDGYEYGLKSVSPHVRITQTSVILSNVQILPLHPNPNDILKVDYLSSNEIEKDNVLVRWYINGSLDSTLNDKIYIRPSLKKGDTVQCEIKHEDSGMYVASNVVSVISSEFIVGDITIDGKNEPLDVSSTTPLVRWRAYIPDDKSLNYINIKIGTFYGADNILSVVLSYTGSSYTIPPNILQKGRDYYLSISLSDSKVFSNYFYSHFRIEGSRWEKNVSNSIGWTLNTAFSVKTDGDEYQIIRIQDGTRFAEIRMYKDKIRLISGSQKTHDGITFLNNINFLTITGKNNDILIYLNKELIINGKGIFTQTTNIKRLELGAYSDNSFSIYYKYFFYTTSGCYIPNISSEYTNLQFHAYMEFEDNEVVSLQSYLNGQYVFGLNPDSDNRSGDIYVIKPGDSTRMKTVARTYAPISSISKSPDETVTVCSHANGVTIIKGYFIDHFNHEIIFIDQNDNLYELDPRENGWELVNSTNYTASYFDQEGFHINTLGTRNG